MRYCVLFIKDQKEHRTPWFTSLERAHKAQAIIEAKYGECVVYVD